MENHPQPAKAAEIGQEAPWSSRLTHQTHPRSAVESTVKAVKVSIGSGGGIPIFRLGVNKIQRLSQNPLPRCRLGPAI